MAEYGHALASGVLPGDPLERGDDSSTEGVQIEVVGNVPTDHLRPLDRIGFAQFVKGDIGAATRIELDQIGFDFDRQPQGRGQRPSGLLSADHGARDDRVDGFGAKEIGQCQGLQPTVVGQLRVGDLFD